MMSKLLAGIKKHKEQVLFISGGWAVFSVILILDHARDKQNYSNIAVKTGLFAISGLLLGVFAYNFLRFILIKISVPGVSQHQINKSIVLFHLPLYILTLYVFRIETGSLGSLNRLLPYIVTALLFLFGLNMLRYISRAYLYLFCLTASAVLITGLPLLWVVPARGLSAVYYPSADFSAEPMLEVRESRISHERISDAQEMYPQKNFGIIWEGYIRIDRSGDYIFSTRSDDGSFVYINEGIVVDNGGYHAPRRRSGRVFLEKGFHSIRVSYFQGDGDYEMNLLWQPPGGMEREIPPLLLYPGKPGLPAIAFILRNTGILWILSWLIFLSLILVKDILKNRSNLKKLAGNYAVNTALMLSSVLFMLIIMEGGIRLIIYLKENRRESLQAMLERSEQTEFTGGERIYSLGGMVKASTHDGMVYELKPDLSGYFAGVPFFTNSRGWRDYEYSLKKADDSIRIAGLGDSCLFGWGIRFEDTTLKILERELNSIPGPKRYEVMNFGVPGYNTAMEADLFINRALEYSPDIALLHFFDNDYDAPLFMKKPRKHATLRKLYIIDFIYSRYRNLMGYYDEDAVTYGDADENQEIMEEYRYMYGAEGFKNAIIKLAETAKEKNITLIVYSAKAYPGLDTNFIYYPLEEEHLELITNLSREHGFYFFNTYPYYIKYMEENPGMLYPRDFRLESDNTHFNSAANEIDALALLDFFASNPELLD